MRARTAGALLVVACACAIGCERLAADGSLAAAVADAAVGLVLLACAAVVELRTYRRRIALLLLASGVTWLLGTLAGSDLAVISTLGGAVLYVHRGPLVQLVLGYPAGRVQGVVARIAVVLAYADGAVVPVAQNDVCTIVLIASVLAIGVVADRRDRTSPHVPGTTAAALLAAGLLPGSLSRVSGIGSPSDSALLLIYESAVIAVALTLTAGLVAERAARVADLVVELGQGTRTWTLRDDLARALRDPSLELGFWIGDGYVDERGARIVLPEAPVERAVTPVERHGEPVAVLVHDAVVAHDPGLRAAIEAAAGLTASNARLRAELQGQADALRDSRHRMVVAGDAQRDRLERRLRQAADVHLEELAAALATAQGSAAGSLTTALGVVQRELAVAVAEVHRLARGIHPRVLSEHGLARALGETAATAPAPVTIVAPDVRFAAAAEAVAYFVCTEALANVAKHADASRVEVEITHADGALRVRVHDDGRGGADPANGGGLRGLADRVDAIGGSLTVASPRHGGTTISASIPAGPA